MPYLTEWAPDIAPPTQTQTKRQRFRQRFGLPWPKTRVGNPLFNDEFLLVNRTGLRWFIYLDWHALDVLEPYEIRTVQRGPTGRVSARNLDDPGDADYLMVDLAPKAPGIELLDISGGEGYFELRLLNGPSRGFEPPTGTTPLSELDLSPAAQIALEAAGISTFDQLRHAGTDHLLDIVNAHPSVHDELIRLMYMCRRGL